MEWKGSIEPFCIVTYIRCETAFRTRKNVVQDLIFVRSTNVAERGSESYFWLKINEFCR